MHETTDNATRILLALLIAALTPAVVAALVSPEKTGDLTALVRSQADLEISAHPLSLGELSEGAAPAARRQALDLRADLASSRIDARSGRFVTLLPATPLVPGSGVGNRLQWSDLSSFTEEAEPEAAVVAAFLDYLDLASSELALEVGELGTPRITAHGGGAVYNLYVPRVLRGVPVRDSFLSATINHGNLVLFSMHQWGDAPEASASLEQVSMTAAAAIVNAHTAAYGGVFGKPSKVWIPLAAGAGPKDFALGRGYRYRLAWVFTGSLEGDHGTWEALVDAGNGDLLSFRDTNHYAEVRGGVYPVANDGVVPDGVEQAGWPMPYQDIETSSGTETSTTGGNISAAGSLTADFYGRYVDINDSCGSSSLTFNNVIDWGTSAGTDCSTPGFGGNGNTHSSRTGFYELNKIIEMARGQLPGNTWLQQRLVSNMNLNATCNAFWNGSVNFYRSGGGCSNTGEIAGVFDHEWGHGLDDNDTTGTIASPSGEGIADIYTALRLNDSCIGRNFRATPCDGFGDPCLTCTGVRDIDYAARQSGTPHTFTWSNANCSGSVHCVGGVYSEAVWSLWKRKLQSPPYDYDDNTAHEIVNRLTYIGGGAAGTWFSGAPPYGGCGGTSGYLNYLAADDDNGDLNDGTPHMAAIFAAFDDQEIACDTPATVQDAGCADVPATAPTVLATPSDQAIGLSWGSVPDATAYQVFRTEGVFGCAFGKVKLGETAGTSWNDTGLQNDRDYSYIVIPVGSSQACMGPASTCVTEAPVPGPGMTPFAIDGLSIGGGDADLYFDNCETADVPFEVLNSGLGTLTNVRVVGATPSNPGVTVTTVFPATVAATLAEDASAQSFVSILGGGLDPGETLALQLELTADELAAPALVDLTLAGAETDVQLVPTTTWSFEADAESWVTESGTFARTDAGGGGDGSWYQQSSTFLDDQCDRIVSPPFFFSDTTTLSLWTQYDIEPIYAENSTWYDRANVGILDSNGGRTSVSPDSGRLYNASGPQGTCGTTGQAGWADQASAWATSGFSAGALGSAGLDEIVQLDIRYGTDASLNGFGFHFDGVTLTDASFLVDDTQPNSCVGKGIFADGFESGDTSLWSP